MHQTKISYLHGLPKNWLGYAIAGIILYKLLS